MHAVSFGLQELNGWLLSSAVFSVYFWVDFFGSAYVRCPNSSIFSLYQPNRIVIASNRSLCQYNTQYSCPRADIFYPARGGGKNKTISVPAHPPGPNASNKYEPVPARLHTPSIRLPVPVSHPSQKRNTFPQNMHDLQSIALWPEV